MPLAATDPDAEARRERIWDEVRTSRPEASTFSLTMLDEGHHVWVQPVGAQGRIEAFLAVGTREQPSQLDRIVAGHALSLFAIELAKSRAVAEAERRLQGDFLDELARGELPPADAARGLVRFGFGRDAAVFAVAIEPVTVGSSRRASRSRRPTSARAATAGSSSRRAPRDHRPAPGERCARPAGVRQGDRPARRGRAPRGRRRAVDAGSSGDRSARRGTRCRSAGSRGGRTPGSSSSAPTGCCSA